MLDHPAIEKYVDKLDHLPWLLLALGAGAVMIYGLSMKRRALRAFAEANMMERLAPGVSWGRQIVKIVLTTIALVLIVLSLLGPRWGTYYEKVHQRQLDLMVCLDVSKSMLAEDAGMSRMDRAKDDIKRLLDRLAGATIGLVTFAGKAELTCPLTDDYEYYRLMLDDVGIHSAPMGGTNLGQAIATARKALGGPRPRDRAIILITDGEDHGASAVMEAGLAQEESIVVYAIGIGDSGQGALVPIQKGGRRTFQQHQGQQVWSKMNPEKLQAIARAGGGEYHESGQVTNRERTLEWIYAQRLAPLQRQAEAEQQVEQRYARFHWFAALALGLLVWEALIRERRRVDHRLLGL